MLHFVLENSKLTFSILIVISFQVPFCCFNGLFLNVSFFFSLFFWMSLNVGYLVWFGLTWVQHLPYIRHVCFGCTFTVFSECLNTSDTWKTISETINLCTYPSDQVHRTAGTKCALHFFIVKHNFAVFVLFVTSDLKVWMKMQCFEGKDIHDPRISVHTVNMCSSCLFVDPLVHLSAVKSAWTFHCTLKMHTIQDSSVLHLSHVWVVGVYKFIVYWVVTLWC